jgi:hypothetical protein
MAGPQITKNKWFANRKSGTYLWTAHLCLGASPSIGHATSFFALCQIKTRPIQIDECRRNNESRERKDYVYEFLINIVSVQCGAYAIGYKDFNSSVAQIQK